MVKTEGLVCLHLTGFVTTQVRLLRLLSILRSTSFGIALLFPFNNQEDFVSMAVVKDLWLDVDPVFYTVQGPGALVRNVNSQQPLDSWDDFNEC